MKHKLVLCSILLMLSFANLTVAKNRPFKNLVETANWSALPRVASSSVSLDKLPYKNILDAAKWSKLKTVSTACELDENERPRLPVSIRGRSCSLVSRCKRRM